MTVPVAAPRSLLYIKLSALGDQVFSLPAIDDALKRHPDLAIDWVVDERFADIARLHGRVRQVLALPLKRWRRQGWWASRHEITAFWRALRAERYDVILDAQGMWKSLLVGLIAHGRTWIGYSADYCGERPVARFYDRRLDMPGSHGALRLRETFAQAIGSDANQRPDYGLVAPPRPEFTGTAPYAVLLHGASKDDKLWSESHWIETASALHTRGLRCVLPWGNDAEHARAERLAQAINAAHADAALVAPRMTIPQCAALMAHAALVIGLDTGLLHLALAYARPTVGIFTATRTDFFYPSDPQRGLALGGPGAQVSVAQVQDAMAAVLACGAKPPVA